MKKNTRDQVKTGFKLAAAWLVGMAWLGLVFWGIVEAFGTEANFSQGRHPSRPLGYIVLAAAAAVFVATASRWKRVLPGIMLAATLGALLELEDGHALNDPAVLIPRSIALVQLLVIVGVTALSFTFKKRSLNVFDRVALLVFAASIFPGGKEATSQRLPLALIVGGLCVLAAWLYDRVQHRRRPENNSSHPKRVLS